MDAQALEVPEILTDAKRDDAVALLQRYFGLGEGAAQRHTGASFETVGHPWNSPATKNAITTEDLIALATLSVPVSGEAVIAVLSEDFQDQAATLLAQIPLHLSITDPDAFVAHEGPGIALWTLVRRLPDFGPTRTSKLLARKRPGLFPIYDRVIADELGIATSVGHWALMRELASRDNGALIVHAASLATDAGVDGIVTPLRVIDVVLWRYGRDNDLMVAGV